ncbi:hypothetical protein Trydic_g8029 [Trypoxylus dichotomus]
MSSKKIREKGEIRDVGYEKTLLQCKCKCDDLPSGESDMSKTENDDTENPNFELVSGKYSGTNIDDGDENLDDNANDIGCLTIAPTIGYIAPSGLVWSLEPPAKNTIAPHNIII